MYHDRLSRVLRWRNAEALHGRESKDMMVRGDRAEVRNTECVLTSQKNKNLTPVTLLWQRLALA
jgi:hypothetical protein